MAGMSSSGGELSRLYFEQIVGPLLAQRLPGLPFAAGRLGGGSDVLGVDDALSQDHDWGLRLTLLVVDDAGVGAVDRALVDGLPDECLGLPTRFAFSGDPVVRHRVEVATVGRFLESRLGVAVDRLSPGDWLSLTGQSVLEVTAGPVFADTDGSLTRARQQLSWYPHDVWLHVIAADWQRVAQELPFGGRTGARGDETGSVGIAGRLSGALLHLGHLLERRWAPYAKWLGTSFGGLPHVGGAPLDALWSAGAADSWADRQAGLAEAARVLYERQREIGLPCVAGQPFEPFHDRPFLGVRPEVVEALRGSIRDPAVRGLPAGVGAVEQWVDNVDVLMSPPRRLAAVRAVLAAPGMR